MHKPRQLRIAGYPNVRLIEENMNLVDFVVQTTILFIDKDWVSESEKKSMTRIIELAKGLNDEERFMLFKLIINFRIIKLGEYESLIKLSINTIPPNKINALSKIIVMPLIAPKHRGKTKSSSLIAYLFKTPDTVLGTSFEGHNIQVIDMINPIHLSNINRDGLIFLVDDFIGTGNTAIECISDLERIGLKKESVAIITLTAMKEGVINLSRMGISVFTSIIMDKGISSIEEIEIRTNFIRTMTILEDRYSIPENYRFGYGKSESLIRLVRPPNNTFPIFWSDKVPNVPFPR